MSWLRDLYDTYESCSQAVGSSQEEGDTLLLPIAHTTMMAHVEITLDDDGTFIDARVVSKTDARTLIPCTEISSARAGSKPEAHPFSDKLQYLAADFTQWGGTVTSGYAHTPTEPYQRLTELLEKWCTSDYAHPKAICVLKYLHSGSIIQDLVNSGVLLVDENNRLLSKSTAKKKGIRYPLTEVMTASAEPWDAVIRWIVYEGQTHETWEDKSLYQKWIDYYASIQEKKGLCFIKGEVLPLASFHPKKIRNDGDNAKLISFNDKNGFTFRGRFDDADQAYGVSFDVTQKAHNALRWLISRQGYQQGDFACVVWEKSGKQLPKLYSDTEELSVDEDSSIIDTNQNAGIAVKKKLEGYRSKLQLNDQIVAMMLDSATPGRLAITYYQTFMGSVLLDRLEHWHTRCQWLHQHKSREVPQEGKKKPIKQYYTFLGTPSVYDMVSATHGRDSDDKLRRQSLKRLLCCILEDLPPPADMVRSAIQRASNPLSMESYEWRKTLSIACSMYNGLLEKEGYKVALETQRNDRSYLYGRLLALADSMEQVALNALRENRLTNAQRYMHTFSIKPAATWLTIYRSINPYKQKLNKWRREYYNGLISAITDMFKPDEFELNKPLTGAFLLGYHSQMEWLKNDTHNKANQNENNQENGGNES